MLCSIKRLKVPLLLRLDSNKIFLVPSRSLSGLVIIAAPSQLDFVQHLDPSMVHDVHDPFSRSHLAQCFSVCRGQLICVKQISSKIFSDFHSHFLSRFVAATSTAARVHALRIQQEPRGYEYRRWGDCL